MTARIDTSPEALAHMLALPDRKLGLSTVEWFDVCMTKEAAFARWSREAVPALAAERDAALAREEKLRDALADAAGALDSAGEELSEFANILSREPWQANHAYESAVQARAALQDAAK